MKKGIILAGGKGTRLYPLTQVTSKSLQPVYDKPMIYYPLSTLMLGGVQEVCIISTPEDTPRYEQLLGDGRQWGIDICYKVQPEPKGIAQAFIIGKEFIGSDPVSLILGDNLFYGQMRLLEVFGQFEKGGLVFAYHVKDPERYGVVEFDDTGKAVSIEEKPSEPKSDFAIPGLYLFDNRVVEISENLKPSARGELEITDVTKAYMGMGELQVSLMGRGIAWLDTGTSSSLQEASNFISIIEDRQGTKVGCPEECALRMGFIDMEAFQRMVGEMPKCEYSNYLGDLSKDFKAPWR
ncbi:MAG: glucose-1-phosphate thymidylyltransferase RfbA [Candidatus Sumerlaeota bacterium]